MPPTGKSYRHKAEWDHYSEKTFAIAKVIAAGLFRTLYRLESVTGTEHIPATGPLLIAANHQSFIDPIVVSYVIPHRVYYLAWSRLFNAPTFAGIIRGLGAIPLDTDRRADKQAFAAALSVMKEKKLLTIFPEGKRGLDSRVLPLESGLFRIALRTGAPILPVSIHGTIDCWPRWRKLPKLSGTIRAHISELITPEEHQASDEQGSLFALKSATYRALTSGLEVARSGKRPFQPGTAAGLR